jgi:hypothetical protein
MLVNREPYKAYRLSICQNSFALFQEKIGFLSERKQARLRAAVTYAENYTNEHLAMALPHNKIPGSELAQAYLDHLKKRCALATFTVTYTNRYGTESSYAKQGTLRRLFPKSGVQAIYNACATQFGFTRHSMQKLLAIHKTATEKLQPLLDDPISRDYRRRLATILERDWVNVKTSKTTNKIKSVYDISVPGPHSYSVSGIMGHNSVLALQLAVNMFRAGHKVAYVSMEMSEEEVYERLVSNISGIEFTKILLKKVSMQQEKVIRKAWKQFDKVPPEGEEGCDKYFKIWVPTTSVSLSNVINTLAPFHPDVVFVDMINLLEPEDKKVQQQAQQLGDMTRYGKIAANSLGIILVLLAQLNEEDKVKYSRAIVENSNNVWTWFLGEKEKETHFFTVKQSKARNQETFDIPMVEDLAHMSISGRDPDDESTENTTGSDDENA